MHLDDLFFKQNVPDQTYDDKGLNTRVFKNYIIVFVNLFSDSIMCSNNALLNKN
jgi:hypothetical protein